MSNNQKTLTTLFGQRAVSKTPGGCKATLNRPLQRMEVYDLVHAISQDADFRIKRSGPGLTVEVIEGAGVIEKEVPYG